MPYKIAYNTSNENMPPALSRQLLLRAKDLLFSRQQKTEMAGRGQQLRQFGQSTSGESQNEAESRAGEDLFTLKAGKENFNVAIKILPESIREHLISVYKYCRYIDDLGDLSDGDRLENLHQAEAAVKQSLEGKGSNKIIDDAVRTLKKTNADEENLFNLIKANIQDQQISRYATFEELCGYCKLSADPVGRLVLSVFGAHNDKTAEYSDKVCTALQIVEHIQDIAEDYSAGRVYMPQEDLKNFRVAEEMLAGQAKTSGSSAKLFNLGYKKNTSPAIKNELKRLLSFECGRARSLILEGSPLVRLLPGFFAKVAVAGFIGGGLAQLNAVEKHNYDVINSEVKASKAAIAICSIKVLFKSYLPKTPDTGGAEKNYTSQLEFRPKSSIARWLR